MIEWEKGRDVLRVKGERKTFDLQRCEILLYMIVIKIQVKRDLFSYLASIGNRVPHITKDSFKRLKKSLQASFLFSRESCQKKIHWSIIGYKVYEKNDGLLSVSSMYECEYEYDYFIIFHKPALPRTPTFFCHSKYNSLPHLEDQQ